MKFDPNQFARNVREDAERVSSKPRRKQHSGNSADTKPSGGQDSQGVCLADFHAYIQPHTYGYAPSREMWPASSVDARISPIEVVGGGGKRKRLKASTWL